MDDEQEIHSLFERGDRALMTADLATLQQIFADDYVQYDPSGKTSSRQEVIDALGSGTVRYPAIVSTGRRIAVGDIGNLARIKSDEVETAGAHFPVRYLYMDVVLKRGGRWQIVGSQLTKLEAE